MKLVIPRVTRKNQVQLEYAKGLLSDMHRYALANTNLHTRINLEGHFFINPNWSLSSDLRYNLELSQLLNKRKRKQFITQQTSHHFFTTPWSDPCSPSHPSISISGRPRIVSGIGTSCIVIYTTFNVEEFRQTKLPPSPYFNVINFTITTLETPIVYLTWHPTTFILSTLPMFWYNKESDTWYISCKNLSLSFKFVLLLWQFIVWGLHTIAVGDV